MECTCRRDQLFDHYAMIVDHARILVVKRRNKEEMNEKRSEFKGLCSGSKVREPKCEPSSYEQKLLLHIIEV